MQQQTGVIIPCYDHTKVPDIIAEHAKHPNVPMVVILNPNSGVGAAIDPSFITAITNLHNAGIIVLGYVFTSYDARPLATVEQEVTNWALWYKVDGINFDEVNNSLQAGSTASVYYQALDTFVHNAGMTYSFGNTGTTIPESGVGELDSFTIYEKTGDPTIADLVARTFYPKYPASNFTFIAIGVPALDTTFVQQAAQYVSYLYITDRGANGTNPYAALPTYFDALVAALDTTAVINPTTPTGVLNWQAPTTNGGAAITGYLIERSIDNGVTWQTVGNIGNVLTFLDKGLAPATTYNYRVSAVNSVGTGATSNVVSVNTSTVPVPTPVPVLTVPSAPLALTVTIQ